IEGEKLRYGDTSGARHRRCDRLGACIRDGIRVVRCDSEYDVSGRIDTIGNTGCPQLSPRSAHAVVRQDLADRVEGSFVVHGHWTTTHHARHPLPERAKVNIT